MTHNPEVLANRRCSAQREARLRRFGYDSAAAIRFVLAQTLPREGAVLEIGTGKGRFLVQLARRVETVTTVDIAAEEQQCARLNARYAGLGEKIRFVLQDAARLPWPEATFDAAVSRVGWLQNAGAHPIPADNRFERESNARNEG